MEPASASLERNVRTLHVAFPIGIAVLIAVFGALHWVGRGPAFGFDVDFATMLAAVMSGIAALVIVVALLILRPRVPRRGSRESIDDYWSTRSTAEAVLRVYFLLEGAGILAAVGFFLTGAVVAALTALAAIFALLLCGPSVFANP